MFTHPRNVGGALRPLREPEDGPAKLAGASTLLPL